MKVFATTIAAGETFIGGAGNFLMLVATTAAVTVKFLGLDGNDLDLTGEDVEAGYKAFIEAGFATYQVTSATTQTIRIGVSRGRDIGAYDRTIGSVDVLTLPTLVLPDIKPDWAKIRTEEDNRYGCTVNVGAVAAQYSAAQIWNPLASGIVLAVRRATASVTTTSSLFLGLHNTALTTLVGMDSLNNNNSGAGAPTAELRTRNSGTWSNLVTTSRFSTFITGNDAFISALRSSDDPILLGPGEGLVLASGGVNATIKANFTWSEH